MRENTQSMQPPRALWVPFPLGRPLGKPSDPAFQNNVIGAALALLHRDRGPVLEDFPHDVPTLEATEAAACPVSFAAMPEQENSWRARLSNELTMLQPWYELSLRRRSGRTLVGVAKETPQENIQTLATLLDEHKTPGDISWLKPAVEDIKAFYYEALTAQPGEYDNDALQHLFWQESSFGEAILVLHDIFESAPDMQTNLTARMLAPREAVATRASRQMEQAGEPSNDRD